MSHSPVITELINRHLEAENKVLRELVLSLTSGKEIGKYEQGLLKDAEIHKNYVAKIKLENGR